MSMDALERKARAFEHLKDPNRPDNMDARMALVERMQRGEITLAEAQAQLAALKRMR
jgi:hypothetical protein